MSVSSDLRKLIVLNAYSGAIGGASYSVMAPYLRLSGFSPLEYGLLGALSLFSSLLFSLISGWLSDRKGARSVLILAILIGSVATGLIAVGRKDLIYAAFLLSGVSGGLASVAGIVLATRLRGDDNYEKILPYISGANSIGMGVGLFGGWIPVLASRSMSVEIESAYRALIALSAVLVPIVAIPLLMTVREDFVRKDMRMLESIASMIPGRGEGVPWDVLTRLLLINAIISLGAGMSIHIIDYYFVLKFNATSGEIGTVLGAQSLLMGLLMLITPRLSKAVGGPLRAYLLIASPSVLLLGLMAVASSYSIASFLYIIRSVLMNVANPLYQAFEMSLIPKDFRGRGASLINLAWQIPAGFGRGIGGALMNYYVELPLIFTMALYSLAFILMAVMFPQYVNKSNRGQP